jgi:arylsulfatase A-like enzyme
MSPAFWPRRRGFQYFYGFLNGTIDYFTHQSRGGGGRGTRTTYRNETPVEDEGYYPDLMTREAVRFIEQPRQKPSFLMYSTPLPHLPLQVPEHWSAPWRHLGAQKAAYAGMIACLDDNVGSLLEALRKTNQEGNTLVVFLSDHGWVKLVRDQARDAGSNGPFRGGKYELAEGGIRSPSIVRWPSVVRPGGVSDAAVINLDWCPTFRKIAGEGDRGPKNSLDGTSLLPLLTAEKSLPKRTLHWKFEDSLVGTPPSFAARLGPWKMLRVGNEAALYDVVADPGETRNLAARLPSRLRQLERENAKWVATLA